MKRVIVLQHVEHEGLGILDGLLKGRGFVTEFVRLYLGEKVPETVTGYSALIVLGGPMGLYEEDSYPFLREEVIFIQKAMKEALPTLGICLGAQLIAKAAGAAISSGKKKEIGWYSLGLTDEGREDHLMKSLPHELNVFQWHGDTFDIPDGTTNLASSALFTNQAIRAGRNAYGLQFHLEVTEDMVREWIAVNRGELEGVTHYIDPEAILKDTPYALPLLNQFGEALFSRFLDLACK
ncbi:MAG: type 1 glutamine amidotransferase [Thermodesulfobacteriota bacterium]